MSLYTIILRKSYTIAARKSAKTVGKTVVIKAGAYIVSMDIKMTVYRLEAGKIAFFKKCVQAVHSNVFPYFTVLPVSSSLYRLNSNSV